MWNRPKRRFLPHKSRPVVVLAYSAGGKGAVPARARVDAESLADDGREVVLVTDVMRGRRPKRSVRVLRGRLWLHLVLPALLREIFGMVIIWFLLVRLSVSAKPVCIIFHSSTLIGPGAWLAKRCGARLVFVVHALIEDKLRNDANPYNSLITKWYRYENERSLRLSDRIACVSRHLASVCEELLGSNSKVTVAANPVQIEKEDMAPPAKDIDLLFVGRLSMEKGGDLFIGAANARPDLVAVVAGDGELAGSLKARARPHVLFLGWVPHDKLGPLYRRARLLVVPSRSEAQGVAVLEALAVGTPVLGARVGGIPEMIRDGINGWLFTPNDLNSLVGRLEPIFSQPDLLEAASSVARESIRDFDLTGHVARIRRAYLESEEV